MKKCSKCKKEKLLSDFNKHKNRHDGYNSFCRECARSYSKQHYHLNKKAYLERNKKRRIETRKILNNLKQVPCIDCGKEYPYYVMDFDHRDGNKKYFNLSDAKKHLYSCINKIMKEIKKCDVVCANCHRIRTFKRNSPLV